MIRINNLSFSYNKNNEVLKNISLEINEGEVTILLGPNGVGKSTLINLLIGTLKIKEGNIYFNDIEINKLSSKDKADYISYVPQDIKGNNLTVKETILLGRLPFYKIYPNKADHSLVEEFINKFSLNNLKDQTTNEISGGERQKVNIARGFIQDARFIIFDEPTSNLDIHSQLDVLDLIKSEKRENKGFLISMHDINQALSIGDKFIFLKDGKIYKTCSKDEIDEKVIDEVYGVKSTIINNKERKYIIYEK